MTTRAAVPADAPTLMRTMALGLETYRAFAPAGWTPLRAVEEDADALRERMRAPGAWVLLAEIAGEPAGHVAIVPDRVRHDTVCLWQLFVRPAWWGAGVAPALHDAFVARAREARYRRGWLRTPAGHARARRFYERHGWRPEGPPDELWGFGMPLITYRCDLTP